MSARSTVGAVVVVVDIPDFDRGVAGFFAAGGGSLAAAQLVARLRARYERA